MQIIEREGHEWCGTQALSSPLAERGTHKSLTHSQGFSRFCWESYFDRNVEVNLNQGECEHLLPLLTY